MKVILQKNVPDVGKVGDVVNVSKGYARNYLFPRDLALEATERRAHQMQHFKKIADSKKKKDQAEKMDLVTKLTGISLEFQRSAGEAEKLFGSVTNSDIASALIPHGFTIDRRDIVLSEPIKVLGQHKAVVRLGTGIEAEIIVFVGRSEA